MYRALVHGGDEVGKLTGPDRMMSQITPDDFRGEKWIDALTFHGSLRDSFLPDHNRRSRKVFEPQKILHAITNPNFAI
jgi:hypothetical protein